MVAGDLAPNVGENAEADPAFHAVGSVIATAAQAVAAFAATDATFDARAPIPSGSKPVLSLMRQTLCRQLAWLRQHHCSYTAQPHRVHLPAVHAAIGGDQRRRLAELPNVVIDTRCTRLLPQVLAATPILCTTIALHL